MKYFSTLCKIIENDYLSRGSKFTFYRNKNSKRCFHIGKWKPWKRLTGKSWKALSLDSWNPFNFPLKMICTNYAFYVGSLKIFYKLSAWSILLGNRKSNFFYRICDMFIWLQNILLKFFTSMGEFTRKSTDRNLGCLGIPCKPYFHEKFNPSNTNWILRWFKYDSNMYKILSQWFEFTKLGPQRYHTC